MWAILLLLRKGLRKKLLCLFFFILLEAFNAKNGAENILFYQTLNQQGVT